MEPAVRWTAACVVLFTLLFMPLAGLAGEDDTSNIGGTVRDDHTDDTIEGVTVHLSQDGTLIDTAVTNTGGSFQFTDLPAGTYDITFVHPQYLEKERTVTVFNGISVWMFVTMERTSWVETFTFDGHMLIGTNPGVPIPCCDGLPGHQVHFSFPVDPYWLETVVVDVSWPNTAAGMGTSLWYDAGCDPVCSPQHEYASETGTGSILYRVDHPAGAWPALSGDDDALELYQWPHHAMNPLNLMLLQDFTIHVEAYYGAPAPAGRV